MFQRRRHFVPVRPRTLVTFTSLTGALEESIANKQFAWYVCDWSGGRSSRGIRAESERYPFCDDNLFECVLAGFEPCRLGKTWKYRNLGAGHRKNLVPGSVVNWSPGPNFKSVQERQRKKLLALWVWIFFILEIIISLKILQARNGWTNRSCVVPFLNLKCQIGNN